MKKIIIPMALLSGSFFNAALSTNSVVETKEKQKLKQQKIARQRFVVISPNESAEGGSMDVNSSKLEEEMDIQNNEQMDEDEKLMTEEESEGQYNDADSIRKKDAAVEKETVQDNKKDEIEYDERKKMQMGKDKNGKNWWRVWD